MQFPLRGEAELSPLHVSIDDVQANLLSYRDNAREVSNSAFV